MGLESLSGELSGPTTPRWRDCWCCRNLPWWTLVNKIDTFLYKYYMY